MRINNIRKRFLFERALTASNKKLGHSLTISEVNILYVIYLYETKYLKPCSGLTISNFLCQYFHSINLKKLYQILNRFKSMEYIHTIYTNEKVFGYKLTFQAKMALNDLDRKIGDQDFKAV